MAALRGDRWPRAAAWVEELGTLARAATVAEAIAFSDVLFLATPYGALPQLSRDQRLRWPRNRCAMRDSNRWWSRRWRARIALHRVGR
jgi:prephenate dehydrogenase